MNKMPIWVCEINTSNLSELEALGFDISENRKINIEKMGSNISIFMVVRAYSEQLLKEQLDAVISGHWQYLDFVGQWVDESPVEGLFNENLADPVSELLTLSKEDETQMPALTVCRKNGDGLVEKLFFISEESRDFLFDRATDFYAKDRTVPPFDTNGSPLNWAHWWDEQDFLDLDSGGTGEIKESPEPSVIVF